MSIDHDRVAALLAAYYEDRAPDLDDLVLIGVTVPEMAVVLDTLRLDLEASRAARPRLRDVVDQFLAQLVGEDH